MVVSTEFRPLVSIIIPVFNGADFLSQAIDSALEQTYEPCEVIVVNDGSQDGGLSETITLSYGNRIRYLFKPNGGVAAALNLALQHALGDYISWLSHDDLYEKKKIERQIEVLASLDDKSTILYSDYSIFTDDPDDLLPVTLGSIPATRFRYWITTENRLHGCTLLIPALAFKEVGGFDVSLRTTQDYDLWYKMSERFKFNHIPTSLVRARQHAGQGSLTMAALALNECNQLYIKFLPQLTLEDLHAANHKSAPQAYAVIAETMAVRGFELAAQAARDAALCGLRGASMGDIVATRARLWYGTWSASAIGFLRRRMPQSIKKVVYKLRRILHSR